MPMRVLIVCSRRYYAPYTDYVAPFIYEQVQALRQRGVECEYYLIYGGWRGYIRALFDLRRKIRKYQPDIIHAHSGLCCLVTVLVRILFPIGGARFSIVSTYHGSDINSRFVRWLSKIAMYGSDYNIFVSEHLRSIAGCSVKSRVLPCSVDTEMFKPMSRSECRRLLGWDGNKTYILFSKEFSDKVKNYPLAKQAIDILKRKIPNLSLIELYGYDRQQMVWLYNACDAGLLTSFSEGSPQFVKEAVACGCPIVSTDVGDVREVIGGVNNCFLTSYEATDVADKLYQAITIGHLPQPHLAIRYTTPFVVESICEIYDDVYSTSK